MARNGSGTYNLPAGNPVTTGTTISSTWANNTLADMATALTGSVASDGQTTPSANLPMGTFAHTNVGNATVRTMYPSAGQLQDGAITYLTSVSGADTIAAVAALGMTAYAAGQKFIFVSAGANTGAVTININSIGAKAITKNGTTALAAGDIPSGYVAEVVYDGTQFQLSNPVITIPTAIPSGVITMWSGSIASIPSGWYLCNGSNSTPDLRDKFIVGAGSTYAVAATGGSADAIVVSHTHTATSTVTDPGHTHDVQLKSANGSGAGYSVANGAVTGSNLNLLTPGTNSNTTGITVGTTNTSTGSSGTNANLPPYYALAYIMKG